jgi:hypothetical protein
MFNVEVTYRTRMGNLICTMTTSATVATRDEAHELRQELQAKPAFVNATVLIKHAKPLATVDEAIEQLARHLREYPPLEDA